MKRVGVLLLLLVPCLAQAGSCGYRYGGYGHATYHGYSSYHQGSYYWPGGYYAGDSYYRQGYYSPGYYDYNHYTQPYFIKYKAVIPLVELPTYGVYVQDSPPDRPTAPSPAVSSSSVDSKLDKILTLTEKTAKDVDSLRVRVEILESRKLVESPPAKDTVSPEQEVVDLFYNSCYACHGEATASKLVKNKKNEEVMIGGGVVLFVDVGSGQSEMANRDSGKNIKPLSKTTLEKVDKALTENRMPTDKTHEGKPVPGLDDKDRQKMIAFVRKEIAKFPKR